MKRIGFSAMIILTTGLGAALAQLDLFPGPMHPRLWNADTLYIGASFVRATKAPISVWLMGSEAGWAGALYFIDPKTGAEDSLLSNKAGTGARVDLSARHAIPLGDTVYFAYRVTTPEMGRFPSANSRLPKYTGPNQPGSGKYVTEPASPKYGHRWSVAGRVNDSIVQFGFEDNVEANSDLDFDDVIFGTNLSLAHTVTPPLDSALDPVKLAYIKDSDGDGQAIYAGGSRRPGGLTGLFRIRARGGQASLEVGHRGAFRVVFRSMDGGVKARVQGMGP